MSFTQEEYETLRKAYAQGVLEVEYGDKTVKYRSLREIAQILAQMRKDLGIGANKKARKRLSFSKGF